MSHLININYNELSKVKNHPITDNKKKILKKLDAQKTERYQFCSSLNQTQIMKNIQICLKLHWSRENVEMLPTVTAYTYYTNVCVRV